VTKILKTLLLFSNKLLNFCGLRFTHTKIWPVVYQFWPHDTKFDKILQNLTRCNWAWTDVSKFDHWAVGGRENNEIIRSSSSVQWNPGRCQPVINLVLKLICRGLPISLPMPSEGCHGEKAGP
jgi:hypothetical protein